MTLGAQQSLDRAALVHCTVALRHLIKRQRQVEHLTGINLPLPHRVDQLGQEAAHGRGATVKVDVSVEQLLAIKVDSVRDADVAHIAATASGLDRLHHRLLRTDTLQHRVRTDSVGQLLDAGDALVTALGHDIGRAKLPGEFLPRLVMAHGDDPFGTHLLRGEHTQQADGAVTDNRETNTLGRTVWLVGLIG